ncbi:MAG: hypothetical protein Q8M94_18135 [Ignavibacteria bacterium]|nr:hypothetical protein [Ignavibacteria bacterium]
MKSGKGGEYKKAGDKKYDSKINRNKETSTDKDVKADGFKSIN